MTGKSSIDKLPMIGGVAALSAFAVLSGIGFASSAPGSLWGLPEKVIFGAIGLFGIVTALSVILSILMGGRWGWVGLVLGLACLGVCVSPPFFIGVAHTYGVIAVFVIWCAGMNMLRGLARQRETRV